MENKPPVHGLRPLKILLNVKLLKEAAHIPLELFALLSPLPAVSISSVSLASAHTSLFIQNIMQRQTCLCIVKRLSR